MDMPLLRMQCYEGLDESKALYEWKYGKQLLYTQILKEKIHLLIDGADTLDTALAKLTGFQDLFFSRDFLEPRPLLRAMEQTSGSVLLIDEIDKADIEFPNDLLQELDRMEFFVYETNETIKAAVRPVMIITSNNEKELPDAFLRRCFFHYIRFPDDDTMKQIVEVHFPGIKQKLVAEALRIFYDIRKVPGLKKKPSTSELLDWLKLLLVEDIDESVLRERDPTKLIPPLHGALLKNEQDVHLFERLAFLARREGNRPGA